MLKGPHTDNINNSSFVRDAVLVLGGAVAALTFAYSRWVKKSDDNDDENNLADDCLRGVVSRKQRPKK